MRGLGAGRMLGGRRGGLLAGMLIAATAAIMLCASVAGARVYRVGTFEGKKATLRSIQKAVDKAVAGDWILVGPGDYKETADRLPAGAPSDEAGAGVLVEKPGVHIRGMSRNGVIIDGTKAGTPTCSSNAADQELGPVN